MTPRRPTTTTLAYAHPPSPTKIVGMGSAGVDYLAQVAAYPHPDEKLRTETLEVQGGGNCGNALTAAARLGLRPAILTKIGDDAVGDEIISEFEKEGILTESILRAKDHPSPFTYIIVDRQGGTRTCIHTPGEALFIEEMTPELMDSTLSGASLVYFDGRLTESALLLAKEARKRSIPVLVEAERLRDALDLLLLEADYVVTSANYPKDFTGEKEVGKAMATMLEGLPKVQWMITTQGSRGSILFERSNSTRSDGGNPTGVDRILEDPQHVVDLLFKNIEKMQQEKSNEGLPSVACTSSTGVDVGISVVCTSEQLHRLAVGTGQSSVDVSITVASAAVLPSKEAVVDTTGAGDAFIGSVLYCIATGVSPRDALKLGSVVAACKCTALGARPGLPRGEHLAWDIIMQS